MFCGEVARPNDPDLIDSLRKDEIRRRLPLPVAAPCADMFSEAALQFAERSLSAQKGRQSFALLCVEAWRKPNFAPANLEEIGGDLRVVAQFAIESARTLAEELL